MPPIIIFIEGNIGTGKTTFLNNINTDIKTQVIYEPVDEWESIGILQKFYEEPKKYCYLFQSYCLHTRFKLLETIDTSCDFVFIERSIMCDKNVFAQTCHEYEYLSDIEYNIYNKWFYYYLNKLQYPYYLIYLQCNPTISYQRIQNRNRLEESSISLEYLTTIHQKHEDWLVGNNKTIVINANDTLLNTNEVNLCIDNIKEQIHSQLESSI